MEEQKLYTREEVKYLILKYVSDKAGFTPTNLKTLITEWLDKNYPEVI